MKAMTRQLLFNQEWKDTDVTRYSEDKIVLIHVMIIKILLALTMADVYTSSKQKNLALCIRMLLLSIGPSCTVDHRGTPRIEGAGGSCPRRCS
jgi:hypothetical protein